VNSTDSRTERFGLGAIAVGLTLVTLANPSVARGETAAVVIEWNRIVLGAAGNWRHSAMMHIAMFDAANSVADAYTPFHVHVPGSRGASQQAAAAQAAHDVLTALFPAQQGRFDAALTTSLAGIPPGLAKQGKEVGRRVARAVLEWRQNDGWPATIMPDTAYVLPPFPGMYQPTPPANSAPTFTFYRDAAPFALVSSTHFLPPSPPFLTSERYARDLNQTKELGAVNSTSRTAEQTLLAQVFHGVNTSTAPFAVWNNVAADLVRRRGLSLIDAARLFALLNASIADGLQTSFTSKFVYNLWRPVTAIRQADVDMNDATTADPNWLPLLPTPPYPSHAGNMACMASAAARALALGFGRDDIPFSATWMRTMGFDNVTREFTGFSQLAQQMALSRIHGGIHFQFESDASLAVCPKVAEYVYDNYMLPR
jgi:hypothetical protein